MHTVRCNSLQFKLIPLLKSETLLPNHPKISRQLLLHFLFLVTAKFLVSWFFRNSNGKELENATD